MDEFYLISKYFKKLSNKNSSAKKLNDDVFFDKKNGLVVSPPDNFKLNFFCSSFSDFEINNNFFFVKFFLFPQPEKK